MYPSNKQKLINALNWNTGLILILCTSILWSINSCSSVNSQINTTGTSISKDLQWSERMALSIMNRYDRIWKIEDRDDPKWSYTHGLIAMSFLHLWEHTGNITYYNYAKAYADDMINEEGKILNYNIDEFNIDHINPGKILFQLYEESQESQYKIALETLRTQIKWQPRTTENGFWHKLRYPWQMWLDGLYMGAPFYAQYAKEFNEPEAYDDIANQFIIMEKNARDKDSGLLYHAWDESRVQPWSDDETGLSPNFWGRAMGWYAMALVDVLDYFPEDHKDRQELINILQRLMVGVSAFQDDETGLWYQVMNLPDAEGNYKEATVSAMMSYAMLKGVRMKYLDSKYFDLGLKAFDGLINNLIEVEEDGEIQLHQCCAVAGLGGSPYRDGSYEYYINEQIRSNDPKGTGPFILAGIELELARKKDK